ncbi:MAG: hypothetical protein PWP70_1379 [Moorella sp. (in: firmicutes)]|nr:hypothetical protein [Moorella sp. (in: firmicutes)]
MAWTFWWKRYGRQLGVCIINQLRFASGGWLTRLLETGRFIKEHAEPLEVSIQSWFQSAWQATTEELQRAWRHLTPLHLPQAWQARALLGLLVLIVLIPGISYYLARPLPPPPEAKPLPANFRADDTNLLARLVAAEAQDEPYPGQVAVVAVVLNRLRHPDFPKTIAGIIFEPWAFESVANGRYWQVQVLSRDYAATHDALNDWDPSNGALYFFNPAKATSPWIWTRPQITQIGNHIFTR